MIIGVRAGRALIGGALAYVGISNRASIFMADDESIFIEVKSRYVVCSGRTRYDGSRAGGGADAVGGSYCDDVASGKNVGIYNVIAA